MIYYALIFLLSGQLTVPPEIKGDPASFIVIEAKTEGKTVKFVPLDAGIQVFPSRLLSDPKSTVVVAQKAGKYRVLCYSALPSGEPTDPVITTVIVGDYTPPLPPNPPPAPNDELKMAIEAIYGASQEQGKEASIVKLFNTYSEIKKIIRDPKFTETEALYEKMHEIRVNSGLDDKALMPIRERLMIEWGMIMGAIPVPLTQTMRDNGEKFAEKVTIILGGIR